MEINTNLSEGPRVIILILNESLDMCAKLYIDDVNQFVGDIDMPMDTYDNVCSFIEPSAQRVRDALIQLILSKLLGDIFLYLCLNMIIVRLHNTEGCLWQRQDGVT